MKSALFAFLLIVLLPLHAHAASKSVLNIQELKTEDGITIWLVEDHSVPIISMNFSFPGGLAFDPDGKTGLSSLLSILLDEGAGDLTSQEFQGTLADHSISLSFGAGRDFFHGALKTLTRNLDKAGELLALALTAPRFDEDAIARMKKSTRTSILQNLNNPGWIAARSFNGLMFTGDPYALPGQGTLESLDKISRDDLKWLAENQFTKGGLLISIAGDITADQAKNFVSRAFGALPENYELEYSGKDADFKHVGMSFLYSYKNPQTHIIAGHKGIPVTDKDWPAAQLINYVLGGGGFDSRLMEEIREKRGLTYGIGTYLSDLKRAPMIQTSFSTSNDNTGEALKLLKSEWARMATTGPDETELSHAKAYLTGSLVLSLTSTGSIAAVMAGLQQHGFDADYINHRNEALKSVTPDQARIVAGRLLAPEKLTIVAVGTPEGFTADEILTTIPGMPQSVPAEKEGINE